MSAKDPQQNSQPDQGRAGQENGLRALAMLGQFLEEDGWHPQAAADQHAYHAFFRGRHGETHCMARIRPDLEQFLFYVVAPIKAPVGRFPAVVEFLTRANYGLRIGNFEFDFSDGEIRYKSSLDFESVILTPQLVKNAIYPAVMTMDRYLPGLMKVIYGGHSPTEAVAEIEG